MIRKATGKDIAACAALSNIPEFTFLQDASLEDACAYLQEFLDYGILLVAEEDGQVLGFITGEFMLGKVVWVDAFTVKETYRGRGIGRKLLEALRAHAKERGAKSMYLMAPSFNTKTVAFYERKGLKKGETFIEFKDEL